MKIVKAANVFHLSAAALVGATGVWMLTEGNWGLAALDFGLCAFNVTMFVLRLRSMKRQAANDASATIEGRQSVSGTFSFGGIPGYVRPAPEPEPTPDLITPVTGYRAWVFSMNDGKLYPANQRGWAYTVWAAGENVAQCVKEPWQIYSSPLAPEVPHAAPGRDCRCGFYATADWGAIQGSPHEFIGQVVNVAGVIEGYGRVIVHETSWRSEKARVTALIDPCAVAPWVEQTSHYHRILDHLSVTYDVPILDSIPTVNAEVLSGNR